MSGSISRLSFDPCLPLPLPLPFLTCISNLLTREIDGSKSWFSAYGIWSIYPIPICISLTAPPTDHLDSNSLVLTTAFLTSEFIINAIALQHHGQHLARP